MNTELVMETARLVNFPGARSPLTAAVGVGTELLARTDPELHALLCVEQDRFERSISLRAQPPLPEPAVTAAMSTLQAASGCSERIEQLVMDRALCGFGANRVVITYSTVDTVLANEPAARDITSTAPSVLAGLAKLPAETAAVLDVNAALGGPHASIVLNGERDHAGVDTTTHAGIACVLESASSATAAEFAHSVLDNAAHLDERLRAFGCAVTRPESSAPFTELTPARTDAAKAVSALAEVNVLADTHGRALRLHTAAVTRRGFGPGEMFRLAELLHGLLEGDGTPAIVGMEIGRLARQFPGRPWGVWS